MQNDKFRDLFLTSFIYLAAFSMMQITVALLWEQHYGLNEAQIGYMFAFVGLSSANKYPAPWSAGFRAPSANSGLC